MTETCPVCGKPKTMTYSELAPGGATPNPIITSLLSRFGGVLPVTCDCDEDEDIDRAVRAMYADHSPTVAYKRCATDAEARATADRWAGIKPPNFEVWADGIEACLAPRWTYEGLFDGKLTASKAPRVTKERPRSVWAWMRELGGWW